MTQGPDKSNTCNQQNHLGLNCHPPLLSGLAVVMAFQNSLWLFSEERLHGLCNYYDC